MSRGERPVAMPTKPVSPLLGYNNNVRHKGKVFHVQTEDSGIKYGHIITHLFMDGGRILKSVKTSYSEYVDSDRMGEIVREMMKQQHKAMFIALRDGKFDSIIDGTERPPTRQSFPAVGATNPPSQPDLTKPSDGALARPQPTPSPTGTLRQVSVGPSATESLAPQISRELSDELALDVDAVERAAAAASSAPPALRSADDLPPPPANLFREKVVGGAYRVTAASTTRRPEGLAAADERPPSSAQLPAAVLPRGGAPAAERRYAPTRPASIFGQARPQQGKSIFGDDLISDKSLDDVILSYLAEDLDGEKK